MQLTDDKQVQQYLELSYGGAALQDSWTLCDVGITSGSVIRCLIKVLQYQKGFEICFLKKTGRFRYSIRI